MSRVGIIIDGLLGGPILTWRHCLTCRAAVALFNMFHRCPRAPSRPAQGRPMGGLASIMCPLKKPLQKSKNEHGACVDCFALRLQVVTMSDLHMQANPSLQKQWNAFFPGEFHSIDRGPIPRVHGRRKGISDPDLRSVRPWPGTRLLLKNKRPLVHKQQAFVSTRASFCNPASSHQLRRRRFYFLLEEGDSRSSVVKTRAL